MVMGAAHEAPLSSQERVRWCGVASVKTTSAVVMGGWAGGSGGDMVVSGKIFAEKM
jgi:hypothetical protein